MNRVEDLDVFKLAYELVLKIYSTTKAFPKGRIVQPHRTDETCGKLSRHEPHGRSDEAR